MFDDYDLRYDLREVYAAAEEVLYDIEDADDPPDDPQETDTPAEGTPYRIDCPEIYPYDVTVVDCCCGGSGYVFSNTYYPCVICDNLGVVYFVS